VFSLSQDLLREQPVQGETRQDLRAKLANRPSGGIVFATIQKFMPGADEDSYPVLSDRHNIVVIADEAHRTQYGFEAKLKTRKAPHSYLSINLPAQENAIADVSAYYQVGYAQHLRDALPNATFVAFTGTPVSSEDRDTRAVFGDYIHIYDMQQARDDGATVPIYFESRLAKLGLKAELLPDIDAEVDELAEDEEDDQQAKLKSRWAALERIVGAEPRIQQVAADLVAHFEERSKAQTGKAMIVAMSREISVHLYNAIIALRPEWHDEDPEKGVIKVVMTGSASDKPLLRPHIYSKQVKKRLEKRFKDPEDPMRLVIVRDMWLTGFDAPCVHTMYIDKPMKGHNLMQAIARVNRVFRDKQGGLVVDYIGIASDLKQALKEYTASKGRGSLTVDAHEAYAVLAEKLDILQAMLHGFDYIDFLTGGHKTLAKTANHVLGIKEGKKRFCDTALAMSKAFTLCCTLDEAKAVREEVAFFQAVKVLLTKKEISSKKKTNEARELAIRQIIGSAVVSEEVVDIFNAVGLEKPNIGILDEAFLNDVRNLPERNLAVELLERLLEGEIKSRFATNVVQQNKFSELLANVIKRYQNRSIETAQVMEELIQMAKKFKEAVNRGDDLGLNNDELAFYDALANNEESVRELGDETLKKIAHELAESLRKSTSVDWSVRESVRASLRLMVKRILRKYKYPPEKQEEAVQLVLEQAESLCAEWA
jgi:type I restriction enzyme R subunit